MLICRLAVGLSKDQFQALLTQLLEGPPVGITRYRADADRFLDALDRAGVPEALTSETHRVAHWSDRLVERLRSGRGSAIAGQRRGRDVENFAEAVVQTVFGAAYSSRCSFAGREGRTAKCDFAIPSKGAPHIVIEAKGYGATGSKMTDVIGDVEKIIAAKRADTAFLFFTDGVTWRQRKSDLAKIIRYQNNGDITRVYTYAMSAQFETDLRQLKAEYAL